MKSLIAGMGITGRAVGRFLSGRGERFDTFDDTKSSTEFIVGTHFLEVADLSLSDYDRVLVSPGLPPHHPLLMEARHAGVPIVTEIELAWRLARGPVIAVTGSNGKSTTASLIHYLLSAHGWRASLCGNIGTPFIDCVDDDPKHYYVLEVSSFQLTYVDAFNPNVGVLLNISPDHLDWHGGFENYRDAKLRLFARQGPDRLAIVDRELAAQLPPGPRVIAVPGPEATLDGQTLIVGKGFSVPLEKIPLLGRHNQENVLFACVAVASLGVPDTSVAASLPGFKGLEHRMERVGTVAGRLWINDSKATNVHACQAAVRSMDMPYVLIMGGCDKGERFDSLGFGDRPPRAIVAYGATAPAIVEDLARFKPEQVHLFRDACLRAQALAAPGEAVLLSPACASLDQFDNFGQRCKGFR